MTQSHNEKIDSLLLEAANEHWTKVAVVIAKVFDAPGFEVTQADGKAVAERLYILVDNGALDVQGNMRRWREADVKLPTPRVKS
jgi:hypothetical protein